jgi:hypothetical protein
MHAYTPADLERLLVHGCGMEEKRYRQMIRALEEYGNAEFRLGLAQYRVTRHVPGPGTSAR